MYKYEQFLVNEIEKQEKQENNSKKGNDKDILINQLEILNKKQLINTSSVLYKKLLS